MLTCVCKYFSSKLKAMVIYILYVEGAVINTPIPDKFCHDFCLKSFKSANIKVIYVFLVDAISQIEQHSERFEAWRGDGVYWADWSRKNHFAQRDVSGSVYAGGKSTTNGRFSFTFPQNK